MNTILRITRVCVVLLTIICGTHAFAAPAPLTDTKYSGDGFSFGIGAAYGIPTNNLTSVLSGSSGVQVQLAWLKKRFTTEGCVSAFSSESKSEIAIANQKIPVQSDIQFATIGFQESYSVVYNDYWRVSPLVGVSWSELAWKDGIHTKYQFTYVTGIKVLYNIVGRAHDGGLVDGLALPFYFKYLYAFPTELTTNVTGGAHFFSVGLEFYLKTEDG